MDMCTHSPTLTFTNTSTDNTLVYGSGRSLRLTLSRPFPRRNFGSNFDGLTVLTSRVACLGRMAINENQTDWDVKLPHLVSPTTTPTTPPRDGSLTNSTEVAFGVDHPSVFGQLNIEWIPSFGP